MNKIKSGTYLYKEIVNKLKSSYIESITIISKRKNLIEDYKLVYVITPELKENKEIYLKLFNKEKYSYINIDNVGNKAAVNVIDISNGDKIYVTLKECISKYKLKYISQYISISLADYVIVNKIKSISESMVELDIALDLGKEIYAIPGDIFSYKNYLANFAIKQGAVPICSEHDVTNIK